jgi:phosphoglycerate dehydrogenase-like enzyme
MTTRDRKLVLSIAPGAEPPPGWEAAASFSEVVLARGREETRAQLADADALLLWDFSSRVLDGAPVPARLAWIHAASLGVDAVLTPEVVASPVIVTNTRGVYERPIAEYVLGLMLAIAKDFRTTFRWQDRGQWQWRMTRILAGQEVALIGPGAIGTEIHRILTAVGCRMQAFGRREVCGDAVFGHIQPLSALERLLPAADTVILALPLTSATRGLMNAERFAWMKPGSTFINIGRGALLDESALLEALRRGRPGIAALDVFMHEPLPQDHPFWKMEQVIVSPHMSADVIGWHDTAMRLFLANLRRWISGAPLQHVVDKAKMAYAQAD